MPESVGGREELLKLDAFCAAPNPYLTMKCLDTLALLAFKMSALLLPLAPHFPSEVLNSLVLLSSMQLLCVYQDGGDALKTVMGISKHFPFFFQVFQEKFRRVSKKFWNFI